MMCEMQDAVRDARIQGCIVQLFRLNDSDMKNYKRDIASSRIRFPNKAALLDSFIGVPIDHCTAPSHLLTEDGAMIPIGDGK